MINKEMKSIISKALKHTQWLLSEYKRDSKRPKVQIFDAQESPRKQTGKEVIQGLINVYELSEVDESDSNDRP